MTKESFQREYVTIQRVLLYHSPRTIWWHKCLKMYKKIHFEPSVFLLKVNWLIRIMAVLRDCHWGPKRLCLLPSHQSIIFWFFPCSFPIWHWFSAKSKSVFALLWRMRVIKLNKNHPKTRHQCVIGNIEYFQLQHNIFCCLHINQFLIALYLFGRAFLAYRSDRSSFGSAENGIKMLKIFNYSGSN